MPRAPIPVVGPSYSSREKKLSNQVTKNLYPSIDQEGKNVASLHAFPGLKDWGTTAVAADRGMIEANGVLYKVSGTTLYTIDSSGTPTSRGTIAGSARCDFAYDNTYVVIVTGGTAYTYNIGTTALAAIGDADLSSPTTVDWINNFFIFDQNDGTVGRWVSSAVSDPTSISALDYAETESHPDDISRIVVHNQLVHFFGTESIEPWWNSGSGRPPFDRVQGAIQPYGLISPWAVAPDGDQIFFVDQERRPRILSGTQTQPFGNNPLHKEWASYATVNDAILMVFTLEDQRFVEVTFPTADRTWCWHEPSNSWFQLGSSTDDSRHRASSYAYCYGKHLFADHTNGEVYELDFDTHTDNLATVERKRITANIHGGLFGVPGAKVYFNKVEFDMEVGVGGSGADVQIRYSDDNGNNWSASANYLVGDAGDDTRRIELYAQGSSYNRIYEITYQETLDFALLGGWADVDLGE